MLQRLSDRLSGIEVLQRQQTERIGTINYRSEKMASHGVYLLSCLEDVDFEAFMKYQ